MPVPNVLGEQAELGHLRVEGVLAGRRNGLTAMRRSCTYLVMYRLIWALASSSPPSVMRAEYLPEIYSCILQDGVKSCPSVLRGEEENAPDSRLQTLYSGTAWEILRHVHAICGISFNPCPIISWGRDAAAHLRAGVLQHGFMLILTHIAAYRAVRAEIEGVLFPPVGPVVICVAAAFSADALGANRD